MIIFFQNADVTPLNPAPHTATEWLRGADITMLGDGIVTTDHSEH